MDECAVEVYDSGGQVSGFLGAAWGEISRPDWPEILLWEHCENLEIDNTLNLKGFFRYSTPDLQPE